MTFFSKGKEMGLIWRRLVWLRHVYLFLAFMSRVTQCWTQTSGKVTCLDLENYAREAAQDTLSVAQSTYFTPDMSTDSLSNTESYPCASPPVTSGKPSLANVNLSISACVSNTASSSVVEAAKFTFHHQMTYGSDGNNNATITCARHVTVPVGMIIRVQVVDMKVNCQDNALIVFDAPDWPPIIAACGNQSLPARTSFTNAVIIEMRVNLSQSFVVQLNVEAVARSSVPNLDTVFLSATQGFIKTPVLYNTTAIDSWARIKVPAAHAVMASLGRLAENAIIPFCPLSSIALYKGGHTREHLVWNVCGRVRPPAAVFHTEVLFLHVLSTSDWSGAGPVMHFSFHNASALPTQTQGDLWNCSVNYWSDFKQHLSCDLSVQCVGGQDELSCPYSSEICEPGLFLSGGSCFMYLAPNTEFTWDDAHNVCMQNGATLAYPNKKGKWDDVTRILQSNAHAQYVFIGLRTASPTLPNMYKWMWQWADYSMAFSLNFTAPGTSPACGFLSFPNTSHFHRLATDRCDRRMPAHILCEKMPSSASPVAVESTKTGATPSQIAYIRCPDGHVTHQFLACDVKSACWVTISRLPCTAPLTPLPPSFLCANDGERVPYSLVCDHREDCADGSDENFCVFAPCSFSFPFHCGNNECLKKEIQCDGLVQCTNGADEMQCSGNLSYNITTLPPPALITFDGRGRFTVSPLNTNSSGSYVCPATHFDCPSAGYCLPIFTRCNGVVDCPGHEDEDNCSVKTCSGFYRCRASYICLHPKHVCDGVFQCPQNDDEVFCNQICPAGCYCYGHSFICTQPFPVATYPGLRFVDARTSGLTLDSFNKSMLLVYLNLAECGLTALTLLSLPNLLTLDLSGNRILIVQSRMFSRLPNLQVLSLSSNPIVSLFPGDGSRSFSSPLTTMDLSYVSIKELNITVFTNFHLLRVVNLSYSAVERVLGNGFQLLKLLRTLDLTACPLNEFPRGLFQGLRWLKALYADNFKICCPATLPEGFLLPNCRAPSDETSSCDALLRLDVYRVFLSLFAVLTLLGNFGSFMYRVFFNKVTSGLAYSVFVTHLCVSDFLMGIYLALIGVADLVFRGNYLWADFAWRNSEMCAFAGFLSLLSREVSAFIICLITLDRFIVLRFPFSRLHFRKQSAHLACIIAWIAGAVLACIPLLPVTSHWQFYSQTSICVPLPITRKRFAGQDYAFGVMIAFNFVLFVLIALGQVCIYWSIQTNTLSTVGASRKSKDQIIARRLFTVVLIDFVCWFPVGLLGLMSSNNIAISGEVSVAITIFILPLNSALNPFLYTLNKVRERRQRVREQQRQKQVLMQLKTQISDYVTSKSEATFTEEEAWNLLKCWLKKGLLSKEKITNYTLTIGKEVESIFIKQTSED